MYFENHLTADDLQRAHDICPNPHSARAMCACWPGSGLEHRASVTRLDALGESV
jgi:hypothetical protein